MFSPIPEPDDSFFAPVQQLPPERARVGGWCYYYCAWCSPCSFISSWIFLAQGTQRRARKNKCVYLFDSFQYSMFAPAAVNLWFEYLISIRTVPSTANWN